MSCIIMNRIIAVVFLMAGLFPLALCAQENGEKIILEGPRVLEAGQTLDLQFPLAETHYIALRVIFKDAAFSGATILPRVNAHRLFPYHAFGGDTRYDNVRNDHGMHPPVASIEANYVLVPQWLRRGANRLSIRNIGPGLATVESVRIRPVSAIDLPRYENPIYFDFDVWRQGLTLRPGTSWYLDTMLMGIINGSGQLVMNYGGNNVHELKQDVEEARLGWGFEHGQFYSIWFLANDPGTWARFIDVDQDEETTAKFHSQFAWHTKVPKGADIVLIDADRFLEALRPGLDGLMAYSTYYIITCEQVGPAGQGFGQDGNLWAAHGYDAATWANNYQEAFEKIARYVRQHNPAAIFLEPHWWGPDIRLILYDTTLARGRRMADSVDGLMTHYYSFPYVDFAPDGQMTLEQVHPERQYPGAVFETPDPAKSRRYMGQWVQIPEIAIDFNRYRLNRTEDDMLHGEPEVNRWGDGRPFRYTAGFDGDEHLYNNETCIYDRNYSAPSAYQFLHAMFSYSLLPTARSEPQKFSITRTLPLLHDEPPSDDIFTEIEVPINRYGRWVEGAAHTQRFQTEDPLYGDLFGYTGFEYGNTGDYIWLSGVKERHHRREPFNSYNLIRRTCYAFVTSGQVYPAVLNNDEASDLFLKTLLVKQDWREILAVYAVNFDERAHRLDVSLPVGWTEPTVGLVFDGAASDWADAQEVVFKPWRGMLRIQTRLAAREPWCVFLYPPTGRSYAVFGGPSTPQPLSPWGNQNVADGRVVLRWRSSARGQSRAPVTYAAQVAREALFRPEDIVFTDDNVSVPECIVPQGVLDDGVRYHWRVRAVDELGRSSGWSRPHAFWYRSERGAHIEGDAPVLEISVPRAQATPTLVPYDNQDNLARRGVPFAHGNYWEGAGKAVDGLAESRWISDDMQRRPILPAWWAVRWDEENQFTTVRILWAKDMVGKDIDVQVWDGTAWKTIEAVRANNEPETELTLVQRATTRAVRLWISAGVKDQVGIAEIYIR